MELDTGDFYQVDLSFTSWYIPTRFVNLKQLDGGAYGLVASAYDNKLEYNVAIKKIKAPFSCAEAAKRTYRELNLLKHMDHPNIVCLMDVFSSDKSLDEFTNFYLVTPLMSADLHTINQQQQLTDDHIQFIIYQILRALKYLHSADIIHRDLKPKNIALNEDASLKLLDFGISRKKADIMTGYIQTRYYRAPEVMFQWMHVGKSIDVWSVGCIMAELMLKQPLFKGSDHINQMQIIMEFTGSPDEEFMSKLISENARQFIENNASNIEPKPISQFIPALEGKEMAADFLEKILILDPDHRLTVEDALKHSFLEYYHDPDDEPLSGPHHDPYSDVNPTGVDEWKKIIWESMQNFEPKLNSLKADYED